MYPSNSERKDRSALKAAWRYLLAAIVCAAFGAVCGRLGRGFQSYCMTYAFLLPLAGGTLPALFLATWREERLPHPTACALWGAGIAALTVGAVFRGALTLYGTMSPLTGVYWIAGGALLVGALMTGLFAGRTRTRLPALPEEAEGEPADSP